VGDHGSRKGGDKGRSGGVLYICRGREEKNDSKRKKKERRILQHMGNSTRAPSGEKKEKRVKSCIEWKFKGTEGGITDIREEIC